MVGKRVGIFDILYECKRTDKYRHKLHHVKCSVCGWETDIRIQHIKDVTTCRHTTCSGSYITERKWQSKRLRNIYNGIITRCYNKEDDSYRWYGAKGIKMCNEWYADSRLFEKWALSNGYADDLTIDRIDENSGYSPENCKWVTLEDNSRYKSTTKITYVDGVGHSGRDWAEILNVGTNVINTMLRECGEDITKEFIRRRLKDTSQPLQHNSWIKTYNLST